MALNDWAHSYRTVANAMKQTADTSGSEAFNPYLKGGVSGAKFNALGSTADITGNVLGTYANAMQGYKENQARAGVAAQNQKNELEKSIAKQQLSAQTDLIAKSDDLKQQMFTPLFGEGFNQDEVQEAINYSIKVDNELQKGTSLKDVQNYIITGADETGLDPLVSQYLNQYAMKAYNLYGNTYQSEELPQAEPEQPEQPSWLSQGWDKIKSALGY
jgi:hypothetical protein